MVAILLAASRAAISMIECCTAVPASLAVRIAGRGGVGRSLLRSGGSTGMAAGDCPSYGTGLESIKTIDMIVSIKRNGS
jgi:hypothetical protein